LEKKGKRKSGPKRGVLLVGKKRNRESCIKGEKGPGGVLIGDGVSAFYSG